MPTDDAQLNSHTPAQSARALRISLKQDLSENLAMKFFLEWGSSLFAQGWSEETAQRILNQICHLLGASHGILAKQDAGTLTIIANVGKTYPISSRIPITGGLGPLLKSPCQFQIQQPNQAVWLQSTQQNLTPFIIPLAVNQQAIGILAFATSVNSLNSNQIHLCECVAGLFGFMLHKATENNQTTVDLSVLNVLTPREREVFALLPSGKSNAELGQLLGIASGTVKIHVERILSKLNLKDRTQAAVKAVELGYSSN